MTSVEERLADLLHEVAPTPSGVSYDAVLRKARRRRRAMSGAAVAVAAVVAGTVAAVVTLASTGSGPAQLTTGPSASVPAAGCYPSPLRLSSDSVRAGASVTVSSSPFACDASYPVGKTYTLVLGQVGRAAPLPLGVVPVGRDGAFSADVRIPASASPGESYVLVQGSAFDRPCQDTSSQSTSCASYSIRLTVLAAGSTTTSTPTSAAACRADALSVHGGRQGGGFQSAHADVVFTNVGPAPCRLAGVPTVALLDAQGTALPVQQHTAPAPQATLHGVVLLPRQGTAWLSFSWTNWCGAKPGPLRISVTLPTNGGTVTGDFDGPPDYNYVPGCVQHGQASTIEVLSAYTSQA